MKNTKIKQALISKRKIIDKIDAQIVKLLNKRAYNVKEIGKLKVKLDMKAHSPVREKQVLKNVLIKNSGPFSSKAIIKLFRQIIEESKKVECREIDRIKQSKQCR